MLRNQFSLTTVQDTSVTPVTSCTLCILVILIGFAFIDSKRNVTLRGIFVLSIPQ